MAVVSHFAEKITLFEWICVCVCVSVLVCFTSSYIGVGFLTGGLGASLHIRFVDSVQLLFGSVPQVLFDDSKT